MKRLSKGSYLGPVLAGYVLSIAAMLFLIAIYVEGRGRDREAAMLLMVPAMLPMMLGYIAVLVLMHKMWEVIRHGRPRTTPDVAVGFLFLPFFNLYWVFQAYWGWTKDFNRFLRERNVAAPEAPEALAMCICIFKVLSMVPFIGLLFSTTNSVLMLIFINRAVDSVNGVIASRSAETDAGTQVPSFAY